MGLFGFGNPSCGRCGGSTRRSYAANGDVVYWCDKCEVGTVIAGMYDAGDFEEDENEYDESLSIEEAANIWMSNGQDSDYTFGYTEEELREALHRND